MTTILAKRVGRSLVSASTQTPASGPLGPVTTPPMSFAPTCCALVSDGGRAASPNATTDARVSWDMLRIAPFLRSQAARVVVLFLALIQRFSASGPGQSTASRGYACV